MRRSAFNPFVVGFFFAVSTAVADAQPAAFATSLGHEPFRIAAGNAFSIKEIHKLLKEVRIDTTPFHKERPLREFLLVLHAQLDVRAKNLGFYVETSPFVAENPDAGNVLDTPVKVPQTTKELSLDECLRYALARVPTANATLHVRRGYIDVTTLQAAATGRIHTDLEPREFNGTLAEVLDELSEITGINILIDRRVQDQAKAPIKFRLVNRVSVDSALTLLTDMADLKYVVQVDAYSGTVYVTTPANARTFEEEMRKKLAPAAAK